MIAKIRAYYSGAYRMYSQGNMPFESVDENLLKKTDIIKGYIYLRSRNIIQGVFVWNQVEKAINNTTFNNNYDTIYDSGDTRVLINQNLRGF